MKSRKSITTIDLESAHILIVEDEEANVKLMRHILESQGYKNILVTRDPRDVLPICHKNSVDLILLDLNKPYMNGYDVMRLLFQECGEDTPPVLVITAQESADFKKRAFDVGARDHLTKPFDISEVISRVRNLLYAKLFHDSLLGRMKYWNIKFWNEPVKFIQHAWISTDVWGVQPNTATMKPACILSATGSPSNVNRPK